MSLDPSFNSTAVRVERDRFGRTLGRALLQVPPEAAADVVAALDGKMLNGRRLGARLKLSAGPRRDRCIRHSRLDVSR